MISKKEAIEMYKPVFYLHPREQYYPVEINYALSACELWTNTNGTHKKLQSVGKVTQQTLVDATNNLDNISNISVNSKVYLKLVDKDKAAGQYNDITNVPIYAIVNENNYVDATGKPVVYWDILYYTMYLYNGSTTILGEGTHDWDHEIVIVRVDPRQRGLNALNYIFLSHHDSGVWMPKDKMQFNGTHPVVYVAESSHAHYHKPAYWPRFFGIASDKTSARGYLWDPPVIHIDLSVQRGGNLLWTHYNGRLSEGEQAFPHMRGKTMNTLNYSMYKKGVYDAINKELGNTRKNQYAVALIIVSIIIMVMAIMVGMINFWTLLIMTPIAATVKIGTDIFLSD